VEKKSVLKSVRGGVVLTLALVSVIGISSCKKDAQVKPENGPVSIANSKVVAISPSKSNYKASQPISLNGVHDITISGDSIRGGALSCISLVNCYNIHITHCKLVNSSTFGVSLSGCTNVVVEDSYVANVLTGVHSFNSRSISVMNNKMSNLSGPQSGGTMVEFENLGNDARDAGSNSAVNNLLVQ
jgi:hypothetical protein